MLLVALMCGRSMECTGFLVFDSIHCFQHSDSNLQQMIPFDESLALAYAKGLGPINTITRGEIPKPVTTSRRPGHFAPVISSMVI